MQLATPVAAVRRRSLELARNLDAYQSFLDTGWNLFAMTEPV